MEKKDPIDEAYRYVENAQKTLRDHGEYDAELHRYSDRKYVRAAGHYLWHAVLMTLDAVFHVRKDRRTRVDIEAYRETVRKRDKKLLALVNDAYQILHLYMGYDGVLSKSTCDDGFRIANAIIDRCTSLRKTEPHL